MNIFQIDEFKLIEYMYSSDSTTDELARKRYVFKVKYNEQPPKFKTLEAYYTSFIEILEKKEDFNINPKENLLHLKAEEKFLARYDKNQLEHLNISIAKIWLTKAKEKLINNYNNNILTNEISIDNNKKLNITSI